MTPALFPSDSELVALRAAERLRAPQPDAPALPPVAVPRAAHGTDPRLGRLTGERQAAARERRAFLACYAWMTGLTSTPTRDEAEAEVLARYPTPRVTVLRMDVGPSGQWYRCESEGEGARLLMCPSELSREDIAHWRVVTVVPVQDALVVHQLRERPTEEVLVAEL